MEYNVTVSDNKNDEDVDYEISGSSNEKEYYVSVENKKNTRKKKWESFCEIAGFVGNVASLISLIIVILFFKFGVETAKEYREYRKFDENSNDAVQEWIEDISDIKIGCSSEFVYDILGEPIYKESIEFYEDNYVKACYINQYCTIMCIYTNDQTLVGFVVIGNMNSLRVKNYRCGFYLFDKTINETEQYCYENGVGSYISCKSCKSFKLYNNPYYFECNMQHSKYASDIYFIGYGI